MNKLFTASALALLIATPALAQDTDPQDTATMSDNNAERAYSDLTDMGDDGDFRVFQDPTDGRFFRLPRNMFMQDGNNTDPMDTATQSDENDDRSQSSVTN